jgi:hypothetical protein
VFLLTRIKEARDSGLPNTEAVAVGLERTGRIVTAAALLFCVAIGAFATSKIVLLKEIGVGMALAVLIDATLVRALLVPSLMKLLGGANWWAPAPLRRFYERFGLHEGPAESREPAVRRKRGVREVAATVVGTPVTSPILAREEPVAAPERMPDLQATDDLEQETFACPVCQAQGRLSPVPPQDPHAQTCPLCYGHGTVLTGSHVPAHIVRDCPECQGLGYVERRGSNEGSHVRPAVPPPERAHADGD